MKQRRLILISTLLLAAVGAFAQNDKEQQRKPRFSSIFGRNEWLAGTNVTGMRCDSVNVSFAQIGADYAQGDNKTYTMAPKEWRICAQAATIKHLQNFSMAGSFSFTQTMSYDARGSMFATPGHFPIDVYEFTPGTKSRQRYTFNGGISADLAPEWRIGGDVDFVAINYAKRKDLRYTTYAMDFTIRPGFQWHSDNLAAGASLVFARSKETVDADQIGSSKDPYYVFINKGMWYGVEQEWQGAGVHLKESGISGLPVEEMNYGGAVQFNVGNLYLEASYRYADGTAGEKDAQWFKFPSHKANAAISWHGNSVRGVNHRLRLYADYKYTTLREAIIESVTKGGITTRYIYGYNTINRTSAMSFVPHWKMSVRNYSLALEGIYSREDGLETLQYPYVMTGALQKTCLSATITGSWCGFTASLKLYGGAGWYKEDQKTVSSQLPETQMYRQELLFNGWKWYETAPYHGGCLKLRYDFYKGLYVTAFADGSFRQVNPNTPEKYNRYRVSTGLAFGYNF